MCRPRERRRGAGGECHLCGDAIYRGEEYYRINGESICCACLECFADKAAEQKASGGAKVNASAALPVQKQQSLSSTAAESLQRAITNCCKGGDAVPAAVLYQQYVGRMPPAQKKFDALLGQCGVSM